MIKTRPWNLRWDEEEEDSVRDSLAYDENSNYKVENNQVNDLSNPSTNLSFIATVNNDLEIEIDKEYTDLLGLNPGDEFEIKIGRKQIRLVPAGDTYRTLNELERGDCLDSDLINEDNISYVATVNDDLEIEIDKEYTEFADLNPGDQVEIKLGRKQIRLVAPESEIEDYPESYLINQEISSYKVDKKEIIGKEGNSKRIRIWPIVFLLYVPLLLLLSPLWFDAIIEKSTLLYWSRKRVCRELILEEITEQKASYILTRKGIWRGGGKGALYNECYKLLKNQENFIR